MIQFKRGNTANWQSQTEPLASGQPGYDKDRKKIKIGDGKNLWSALPDASGLRAEEILESEEKAKEKIRNKTSLSSLVAKLLNLEDRPIITYGTETPDDETVGQIYLQYYDDLPEVDFVIDAGVNRGWTYQKWKSGRAECWCTKNFKTDIKNAFEGVALYYDNKSMSQLNYPISFSSVPSETATVQSSGGLAWLASRKANTKEKSGAYSIISSDSLENASYCVSIQVKGFWK